MIFQWKGPGREAFRGEGATRDMSVEGIFVLTSTCPPPDALVRLEVILPLSNGGSTAQMKSLMKVVRVDHDLAENSRSGFSATGKGFLLSTLSERASREVADLIKGSKEAAKLQR